MSCFKIVSIILSVIISGCLSSRELSCGPYDVVDDCPSDCAYNYCPKDQYHDRKPCPNPEVCPPPACKCGFNYRRADNGTCIPTKNCPPFKCTGVNEEFNPCPFYCPSDDCRDASLSGECPYLLLIVVECSPTCRCIKHHWRKDGVCVPYKDCPSRRDTLPLELVLSQANLV